MAISKIIGKRFTSLAFASLRKKIILVCCGISFLTAIIMGAAIAFRTEVVARDFASQEVAHETRLLAQQLGSIYEEMENDAFVVSRTPPIEGILRSDSNTGVDPLDGSTSKAWRQRLQTIFASLMQERPAYTQMRYISARGAGAELVRTNRTSAGLENVAEADLQLKGEEDYLLEAQKLNPGQAYFSKVTYNRENGEVENTLTPTIRAIVPVFQEERVSGFIVINANYEDLINKFFDRVQFKGDVFIETSSGDYIARSSNGVVSRFISHQDPDWKSPNTVQALGDFGRKEWSFLNSEGLTHSVRLPINNALDATHNVISVKVSSDYLYANADQILDQSLILTLFLTAITVAVGAILAHRLTLPLSKMTQGITAAIERGGSLDLPLERQDEVGELANAFRKLVDSRDEHDARAKSLVENVVDSIIVLDETGRIRLFNKASQNTFGLSDLEAVGQDIRRIIPGLRSDNLNSMSSGSENPSAQMSEGFTHEAKGRKQNGQIFPIELTISRLDGVSAGNLFTLVVRDITKRVEMEDELRAARDAAEAAARAKAIFLANMSHDIRTPMNGVLGFADLLLESELSAEQRMQVEMISESGRSMAVLLNDILDLSKIDAKQMTIAREPLDLRHKINSVLRLMRVSASHKQLEISAAIDEEIAPLIMGDKLRFRQVLSNLVGNAVKFTDCGTVKISARISQENPGPAVLEVCVSDSGIGIDADRLDDIFDEFAQEDGSTVREFGGTGLGLAISRSLAKLMGGDLKVSSVKGEGSTFILTLPYEAAMAVPELAQPENRDECRRKPGVADTRRILVAEDHEINQRLMRAVLSQEGYIFELAADGAEAIEMVTAAFAAGDPYRLVLMDIQMPRIDGLEATRKLRSAGHCARKLPIIAMTANAYRSDIEDCLTAGMQAHLAKPVRLADLRRALATWLPRDRASDAAPETRSSVESMRADFEKFKAESIATLQAFRADLPRSEPGVSKKVCELMHKLKGTAALFGEARLGEIAGEIEQLIVAGDDCQEGSAIGARIDEAIRLAEAGGKAPDFERKSA